MQDPDYTPALKKCQPAEKAEFELPIFEIDLGLDHSFRNFFD